MYSKHDIDVHSIRHMPRSSVPRIMDGVASIAHIPSNKRKKECAPVERLNPVRYKARVEREAYAHTLSVMTRSVESQDVLCLLERAKQDVPENIYSDLIHDVLERCK